MLHQLHLQSVVWHPDYVALAAAAAAAKRSSLCIVITYQVALLTEHSL
jgi:hypothetical protein